MNIDKRPPDWGARAIAFVALGVANLSGESIIGAASAMALAGVCLLGWLFSE